MSASVSRIMVRQPQCYANSGDYVNGMPFSLTLGCGTWGGNIASENITWKHFINTTWVSAPIEPGDSRRERHLWRALGQVRQVTRPSNAMGIAEHSGTGGSRCDRWSEVLLLVKERLQMSPTIRHSEGPEPASSLQLNVPSDVGGGLVCSPSSSS